MMDVSLSLLQISLICLLIYPFLSRSLILLAPACSDSSLAPSCSLRCAFDNAYSLLCTYNVVCCSLSPDALVNPLISLYCSFPSVSVFMLFHHTVPLRLHVGFILPSLSPETYIYVEVTALMLAVYTRT
jgi:hypothetical protein